MLETHEEISCLPIENVDRFKPPEAIMKRLKIFPALIFFCSTLLVSDPTFTAMRGVQVTVKRNERPRRRG